ncbi:MAG: glycerol-3-phosphate 1-O-acyltransferase PlsY [Lachnospiraceae bacterium]|nr:glycerol-3-phosphate 1-O-acyltransferase PlsY [Lachnospiraceae bacterium]
MGIRIICLLVGFVCGSIPTGYLLARSKGIDLKHTGSGNVGSTNVLRSMGKKYGAITMVCDMLKSIVPIIVMSALFGSISGMRYLITLYTGLGAVLGHDFSPWLGFNGGKGIATSGGVILTTDPIIFVIDFVTIFGTAIITGYVSVGSMLATIFYFIFNIITVVSGRTPGWSIYPQTFDPAHAPEILIISGIMSAIAIYRHKANIVRLMNGNENKIKLIEKA